MKLFSIFAMGIQFINIIVLGCLLCGFILFIKLAVRGIKALDIYIEKNNNKYL